MKKNILVCGVLLGALFISSCGTTVEGTVYRNGQSTSGSFTVDGAIAALGEALAKKPETTEPQTPASSTPAETATKTEAVTAPATTTPATTTPAATTPASSPASSIDMSNLYDSVASALNQLNEATSTQAMTPEDEYYTGRAVGANILTQYKVLNNPALTAYLNNICAVLVGNSPVPDIFNGYYLVILDTTEICAFATPGGHIFISTGLIAEANDEDALAAVIAHEIAHIQLKHAVKIIEGTRTERELGKLAEQSAAAAAEAAGLTDLWAEFASSIHNVFYTLTVNGYSQVQEFEADTTALILMAASGYRPSAMLDILQVLDKDQANHPGGFNTTHPSPALRIDNVNKSVNKYTVPDTREFRLERFLALKIK
jgi:predicted Zn-dependent protease